MSKQKEQMMSVRILPNTTSNPPGKLADAEVVFEAEAGPLTGILFTTVVRPSRALVFTLRSGARGGSPNPIRRKPTG